MPNYDPGLRRVLKAAGGPAKVAQYLGINSSAVTQWSRAPARHVPRLEAFTGIPGHIIRPDLYSAPKPKAKRRKRTPPAESPPSESPSRGEAA